MKRIVLGGGCFWCVEAVFEQIQGVTKVVSGYAGGKIDLPTYEQICTGATGHAEVICIDYDPGVVTLDQLLDVFFVVHDPTTLNQQGADRGTQYRSVAYFDNALEEVAIREAIQRCRETWPGRVVTEVTPLPKFFPAEPYHQGYFREHPNQPYCLFVAAPKVAKFMRHFPELAKEGGNTL